jgi:4-amino-4-deoxy-L-arabinose transferase-like glycosyltransferase
MHMLQIAFPSDGSMIFDEAHYQPAAVATLNGIAANAEHPPFPKIISAIGIALLGNNWFGWRFPQVLMQVAALYLFYLIIKRFLGDPWALGGTMLLGLDTVFFIHGGALLIDMPIFLFGFLAVELYFRRHYWLSAASLGLAFASREMSVFLFGALAVYHIYANRGALKPALKLGCKYMLVALLVFGTLMFAYDLSYLPPKAIAVTNYVNANIVMNNGTAITTLYTTIHSTSKDLIWNPIDHVLFIYHYHGPEGLVINESYAPYQYPWNWVLPFDPVPQNGTFRQPDPFNSPTYFRVDVQVSAGGPGKHYIPMWYRAQANLPVWYGFWPALVGCIYVLFRRKPSEQTGKDRGVALFSLVGILLNFVPWIVLSVLVRRIGFNYYMIYTLPFIALGVCFAWKQLPEKYGKKILFLNVLLALLFFWWFFPIRPMP